MAVLGKNRPIQPSQTDSRQADNTNRDTRLALGGVQTNLEVLNEAVTTLAPSFMPVDDLTDLYWPMDDAVGSLVAKQVVKGKDFPLTFGSGAIPGYVSEMGGKSLRLSDASPINVFARVAVTATPPTYATASLSCWFWVGIGPTSTDRYIFGNWTTALGGTHFNIYCGQGTNGIVTFKGIVIASATVSCSGPGEAYVTAGDWHHVGLTYNGTILILYVDGRPISSAPATGNIQWTASGGSVWNIGSGSAGNDAQPGFIQDVRVSSTARPREWMEEAYLRGKGRFF